MKTFISDLKAIKTKFIHATNTKPDRIKAGNSHSHIFVSVTHMKGTNAENHLEAANAFAKARQIDRPIVSGATTNNDLSEFFWVVGGIE